MSQRETRSFQTERQYDTHNNITAVRYLFGRSLVVYLKIKKIVTLLSCVLTLYYILFYIYIIY